MGEITGAEQLQMKHNDFISFKYHLNQKISFHTKKYYLNIV
jgi:hypothetical protein